MLYLSQVIGKPVTDAAGEAFDTVADLVIYHGTERFPRITGVLLKGDRSRVAIIPWDAVAEFGASGIRLRVERRLLAPRPLQPDEILLRDDVLDGQVVDTDDIKVVRVNDIELRQTGTEVRVVGADISTRAILRRLGLEPLVVRALERMGRTLSSRVIPWNLVAVLGGTMTPLKLSISREKLKDIHPADLADLLEELARDERVEMMTALPDERAADVLEEAEPEVQTAVLQELPSERASDILEEMAPDEAADALGELSEERAEELISLMEDDEAEEVSRLLQYPPETAAGEDDHGVHRAAGDDDGGAGAGAAPRDQARRGDDLLPVRRRRGTAGSSACCRSARLIMAAPGDADCGVDAPRHASRCALDTSADDVAAALVKYDLLAVPVVDESGRLLGIVTVDHLIDTLLEQYGPRKLGGGMDLVRRRESRAGTPPGA